MVSFNTSPEPMPNAGFDACQISGSKWTAVYREPRPQLFFSDWTSKALRIGTRIVRKLGYTRQKGPAFGPGLFDLIGRLPGLPHTCACSTIGAERLNCRVRDGNGWDPLAMVTQKLLRCSQISRRRRETFGTPTLNIDGPLKPLILFLHQERINLKTCV